MGDTVDLVKNIALAMSALVAAAYAWARINRSSERKEDRAALKQINEGLREELVFTEERRDRYRKDAHDLRGEIHRLEMEKEASARKHHEEKQELYEMLNKAHNDLTILQLQLDAERTARHHREGRTPEKEA